MVQVAGCGQPRGESNALGAREQGRYVGSQDQTWPFTGGVEMEARKGGDLSEVTDICLPPPHSLGHATLSQTLRSLSYGVWRVGGAAGSAYSADVCYPLPPALGRPVPAVGTGVQEEKDPSRDGLRP